MPKHTSLDFSSIEDAQRRLSNHIRKTPCVHSEGLSSLLGSQLFLKLENLQRTGAFKERGALNKLLLLSPEQRARGVITASAGNHARGLAYHARRLDTPATICMPETTPLIKVQRTRSLGAEIILHGEGFDDAYAHALEVQRDRGLFFVHPFDDLDIIAGQASIALETLRQNPWIDLYVVPVGGGGLIAGMALALKETNPRIKVVGVESSAMPGMSTSLSHGVVTPVPTQRTLADGIAVSRVGQKPFEIIQRYVDDIVTVDDEETANAILLLLEEEKTVAEAASATTIAALVHDRIPLARDKRVCAVISGGNIDVNVLSRIIERGLVKAGRLMRVSINLPDAPGALASLTTLLATTRANILETLHNRTFNVAPFGQTTVVLTLETRGPQHIQDVLGRLHDAGFDVVRSH